MSKKFITKYFNIHGLVKIKVCSSIPAKINTILHQIKEFEEPSLNDRSIDLFIYDYSKHPKLENTIVLSNYYYYSKNYLNIPVKNFCFNLINKPFIIYCNRLEMPLNFLIELVLIQKKYTLVHAAATKYGEKCYLFPAFGGVGKTTAVAAMMFRGGQLYGDDMVIIKNKKILNYPMDFSIYPYHLNILKIKDKNIKYQFKKTKILNFITKKLDKKKYRINKLLTLMINSFKTPVFNVSPRKIFGNNYLASDGQIDEIYYLLKKGDSSSEIITEKIDQYQLAEICTNILFQEWHQAMAILHIYSGLSEFSINSFFNKINEMFNETFKNYKCYQITIPVNLKDIAYQKQLISYLNNNK